MVLGVVLGSNDIADCNCKHSQRDKTGRRRRKGMYIPAGCGVELGHKEEHVRYALV